MPFTYTREMWKKKKWQIYKINISHREFVINYVIKQKRVSGFKEIVKWGGGDFAYFIFLQLYQLDGCDEKLFYWISIWQQKFFYPIFFKFEHFFVWDLGYEAGAWRLSSFSSSKSFLALNDAEKNFFLRLLINISVSRISRTVFKVRLCHCV